jgi:REP element-mobilizing transposase RayT
MARAPRIEYEGALYHVINRGIEKRSIFASPSDRGRLLRLLAKLKERYKTSILAYCIMPNHFHLLIRTALPNLHSFMKDLDGEYSRIFNLMHGRIGPLFQGRYRALLVEDSSYALEVARYIHMNPVKAGLAVNPGEYRWSSYGVYQVPRGSDLVDKEMLLSLFPGVGTPSGKCLQFKAFTLEDRRDGYDPVMAKGGVIAGRGIFLDWVRKTKIPRRKDPEMARWKELQEPAADTGKSLESRVAEMTDDPGLRRKLYVYALRRSTPLTLKEVAARTGLNSVFAVSQTVTRLNRQRMREPLLDELMARLDARLRSGQ